MPEPGEISVEVTGVELPFFGVSYLGELSSIVDKLSSKSEVSDLGELFLGEVEVPAFKGVTSDDVDMTSRRHRIQGEALQVSVGNSSWPATHVRAPTRTHARRACSFGRDLHGLRFKKLVRGELGAWEQ